MRLSELFEGMMRAAYDSEGAQLTVDILASDRVKAFIEAHAALLDSSFSQVEMSEAMRRRLHRSDFIFSGLKTFHELNEVWPLIFTSDGTRRTFEQFLDMARKTDGIYNRNYLRAEYNFIASSAEMAAKWETFAADGDRYNLQYRTQQDDRVRPEHAALDGVTLPPSDPFWAEFYPPNGWNCRCTVVQVRPSKYPATDRDEAVRRGNEALQRDTRGMFRFNPGIEGSTVPKYNPYTIRRCRDCDIAKGRKGLKLVAFVPDNEVCQACKYLRACLEFRREPGFTEFRKELAGNANHINAEYPNLATGSLYQTRKSFKRGISHAMNIEEAEMFSKINNHISELEFIRASPLGEVKNLTNPKDLANIKKKKDRGVTGYNIYTLTVNGERWIVKTEVFKNRTEAVYHIMRKE